MDHLFISLRLGLDPEDPAWYVQASIDGKLTVAPVEISIEAAQELASAFNRAMQSTEGELPQVAIPQLVESGSQLIVTRLREQLAVAEAQAARVDTLRKRLGRHMANRATISQ